jgi:hypothetical protein
MLLHTQFNSKETQGISHMLMRSSAEECTSFYKVGQVASRGGGRSTRDCHVIACAHASLESFRPFLKHAEQRLQLPLIYIAAQTIKELRLGDEKLHLFQRPLLGLQCDG